MLVEIPEAAETSAIDRGPRASRTAEALTGRELLLVQRDSHHAAIVMPGLLPAISG